MLLRHYAYADAASITPLFQFDLFLRLSLMIFAAADYFIFLFRRQSVMAYASCRYAIADFSIAFF